jgi:hypothetical protein
VPSTGSTIATGGAVALSASVKERPLTSVMPIVWKYAGDASLKSACGCAWWSVGFSPSTMKPVRERLHLIERHGEAEGRALQSGSAETFSSTDRKNARRESACVAFTKSRSMRAVRTRSVRNPASTCWSLIEAANQQSGADEQHERNRDLRDDQHVARAKAAPAGLDRHISAQASRQLGPPQHDRHDAEEQAGQHGDADREGEHQPVDGDLHGARREARGEVDEQIADEPRAEQTQRAAGQRQHDAFRHELTRDSSAARAKRGADGQLALAPQHPRQRQVGDVGGDEQQDENGSRQQDEQRRTCLARQLVMD